MKLEDNAFRGQTPWFGPFLSRYSCRVSSTGERLASGKTYQVQAFIFDKDGILLRRGVLGRISAAGGATFNLDQLCNGIPEDTEGCVALLTTDPDESEFKLLAETWMIRFVDNNALVGVINSATAPFINHPGKTGKRSRYRMVSQAIDLNSDMCPVSCHINASANPGYDTSSSFRVKVYNNNGEVLTSRPHEVRPFGCAWFDLVEEFGPSLISHLGKSGGRGAYTVESDDSAAVGYHFIFNKAKVGMAADHTRPIIKYLDMGYGEDPLKKGVGFVANARAAVSALKFTWLG